MHPSWHLVHAERAALISDLADRPDSAWDTPSLCPGWSVHDVAAHLVDCARTTSVTFFTTMLAARFDFDRQNQAGVEQHRGATPSHTLAALREVRERTSGPPRLLAPIGSRLVEEIAHGEDIRRPLNISRTYPAQAVSEALTYLVGTGESFGGAKELARTVRLEADDMDLVLGSGPAVRGPGVDLLLLATRRPLDRARLSGPGVDHLAPPA